MAKYNTILLFKIISLSKLKISQANIESILGIGSKRISIWKGYAKKYGGIFEVYSKALDKIYKNNSNNYVNFKKLKEPLDVSNAVHESLPYFMNMVGNMHKTSIKGQYEKYKDFDNFENINCENLIIELSYMLEKYAKNVKFSIIVEGMRNYKTINSKRNIRIRNKLFNQNEYIFEVILFRIRKK